MSSPPPLGDTYQHGRNNATMNIKSCWLKNGNCRLTENNASPLTHGGAGTISSKRNGRGCFLRRACLSVGMVLGTSAAHGAVLFSVGSFNFQPNNLVSVPITVSGFSEVTTFQFTLAWDPAVLQFSSVGNFGLTGLAGGNFGAHPDRLGVSWDDPNGLGVTAGDGTTIFSLNFNVIGGAGQHSSLDFVDDPTPREVTVGFAPVTLEQSSGQVDIAAVPEPENLVLANFGLLLATAAALRGIRHQRLSRRNDHHYPPCFTT
jgi:hypothetical protein